MQMAQPILTLENIHKSFDGTKVLDGISLSVLPGQFITLLGPSGCGKTTTLRIIAGLETPDEGRVLLNGAEVTKLPPEKRAVNTVFQNYALFPHMNVLKNIAYPMKLRRVKKEDAARRVEELLSVVQLEGFGKRMPSQLSGGQRQRVAIARALACDPQLLLLDEPLGALDLQLRRQMQGELKALQKKLGITFIYITHDQEEALNMSDRIAVMREGRFEQIGTPAEVYDRPRTSYVARFVGTANVLTGTVKAVDGDAMTLACAGGCARVQTLGHPFKEGQTVNIAVRSEQVEFEKSDGGCGLPATVKEKSFAGGMLRIALALADGSELIASRHGIDIGVAAGDKVDVTWSAFHAVPVDVEGAHE